MLSVHLPYSGCKAWQVFGKKDLVGSAVAGRLGNAQLRELQGLLVEYMEEFGLLACNTG